MTMESASIKMCLDVLSTLQYFYCTHVCIKVYLWGNSDKKRVCMYHAVFYFALSRVT